MEDGKEDAACSLEGAYPVVDFKYELIQEKACLIPISSYLSVTGLKTG